MYVYLFLKSVSWKRKISEVSFLEAEFPIVSSISSTLEEPVWVSEEPKEYNAKQKTFLIVITFFKASWDRIIEVAS